MNTDAKLQRALDFLKEANKGFASEKDVARAFKALADKFMEAVNAFKNKADQHIADTSSDVESIRTAQHTADKALKEHKSFTESALETATGALNARIDGIKDELPAVDLSNIETAISGLESAIAELPEPTDPTAEIEEKTDALRQELEEEIEKLRRRLLVIEELGSGQATGPRVVPSSRPGVYDYDLSPYLNGVTKTFALPAFGRVVLVQSTSSPTAFRRGIDYTVDGHLMTITFTSEITAAATLATGQSVVILYVEP